MIRLSLGLAVASVVLLPAASRAQTLDAIRTAHHLDCGTVANVADWNNDDLHGDLSALGVQICRAVAVAILGDPDALTIHSYPGETEALAAIQSGVIQLVTGVSPEAQRAVHYGVAFGPPIFYDTQRFLVLEQSGIKDLNGLRDRLVCAMDMTKPERVLHEEMAARGIPYALQAHSEQGEMDASVAVGRCAAGTATESRLAGSRADFPANAPPFRFLPERFGLDPVVPAYRYGDQVFGLVVDWTVSALIEAEALGITQANVAAASARDDIRAERLLGHDFATAQALGLAHDWAAKVIAATGNYGEIFDRTIAGPYRLERGLNGLWTQGGLMAPRPMQ